MLSNTLLAKIQEIIDEFKEIEPTQKSRGDFIDRLDALASTYTSRKIKGEITYKTRMSRRYAIRKIVKALQGEGYPYTYEIPEGEAKAYRNATSCETRDIKKAVFPASAAETVMSWAASSEPLKRALWLQYVSGRRFHEVFKPWKFLDGEVYYQPGKRDLTPTQAELDRGAAREIDGEWWYSFELLAPQADVKAVKAQIDAGGPLNIASESTKANRLLKDLDSTITTHKLRAAYANRLAERKSISLEQAIQRGLNHRTLGSTPCYSYISTEEAKGGDSWCAVCARKIDSGNVEKHTSSRGHLQAAVEQGVATEEQSEAVRVYKSGKNRKKRNRRRGSKK